MHKLVLKIFSLLCHTEKAVRLLAILSLSLVSFYWFKDMVKAEWNWFDFIKPPLDCIINTSNRLVHLNINFGDKIAGVQYFNCIIAILLLILFLKLFSMVIEVLQNVYEDIHLTCKKEIEKNFNKNMQDTIDKQEKIQQEYCLYIQTRISKKQLIKQENLDINEQNKLLNDYIFKNTGAKSEVFLKGFLYYFENFEKADKIIELLFKIKKTDIPVDYIMCIQIGKNLVQLEQLADKQYWGKIIIAADTLYRYKRNSICNYKTSDIGIFQKEGGTLEVHEIIEQL